MLTLNDGRKELYQWDVGVKANVEVGCDEVHFSNVKYGLALVCPVVSNEVEIPNQLLIYSEPINCWAFVKNEDNGYTRAEKTFEVIKRPKPSDYVYIETEVLTIEKVVSDALQEAKESGDFKGETGKDGFSPTVEVTKINGGHKVTITDTQGKKSFDVMNGQDGKLTTIEIQTVDLDFVLDAYVSCEKIGDTTRIFSAPDSQFSYAKIPVQDGEVYYYSGRQNYNARAWVLVDNNNVAIRIDSGDISSVSTIDEKITINPNETYMYVGKDAAFNYLKKEVTVTVAQNVSNLTGKKIVYDGDSICIGTYGGGGYAKIIAEKVNGIYENQAAGGGRLVTATSDSNYHSIVDNLENLPKDGDLYCFNGGLNDVWGLAELGTYDMFDYTGAVDKTTICGALETIFRYCLDNFIGKPICFIITHKVSNINFENYKNYHDNAVTICNKYSIPYYDAYNNSGLNGWNATQSNTFLTGNSIGTADGCHPNEEGYQRYYVPQLISLFESIIPINVAESKVILE